MRASIGVVITGSLLLGGAWSQSAAPPGGNGCGPAEAVEMSGRYQRAEDTRSRSNPRPIVEMSGKQLEGAVDVTVPGLVGRTASAPDGLKSVFVIESLDVEAIQVFFANSNLTADETLLDFFARGGVTVRQTRAGGTNAAVVIEEVGDRATMVAVGDHAAAMVHSDELRPSLRTYHLYWSDGDADWALVGNADHKVIIDMARSLYCGR